MNKILSKLKFLDRFNGKHWRTVLGPWGIFIFGAFLGVVLAILFNATGPDWLTFTYWQDGGGNTSRSEVLRNLGLLTVAGVGLGFGVWRATLAFQQTRVSEQGLFTDRFSQAVEHLGSEQLPVRLGGIYALWRLAEDSDIRDKKTVWDILSTFVRNPPHTIEDEVDEKPDGTKVQILRSDTQAILNLFTTREISNQMKDALYKLNLKSSDLRGAELEGAILSNAKLSGVNLSGVNLNDADLSLAHMISINLNGAFLINADLSKTEMLAADLSSAFLSGANLNRAHMVYAKLSDTHLYKTNLEGVIGLDQEMLKSAVSNIDNPPINLPEGLYLNSDTDES